MCGVATEATEFGASCGRSSSSAERGAKNNRPANSSDSGKTYCYPQDLLSISVGARSSIGCMQQRARGDDLHCRATEGTFGIATEATQFGASFGRSTSSAERGVKNKRPANSSASCMTYGFGKQWFRSYFCLLLKAKPCTRSLPLLAEPQQDASRHVAPALLRGGHLGSSREKYSRTS